MKPTPRGGCWNSAELRGEVPAEPDQIDLEREAAEEAFIGRVQSRAQEVLDILGKKARAEAARAAELLVEQTRSGSRFWRESLRERVPPIEEDER